MTRRRGRPGLLGAATRTAVVAGTAAATVGAVSHHQATKQADAAPPTAPQPATDTPTGSTATAASSTAGGTTGLSEETMAKLTQLSEMHASGILSDEEFTAAKARLLGM